MRQLYAYVTNESTLYVSKEFYQIRSLMNDDARTKVYDACYILWFKELD